MSDSPRPGVRLDRLGLALMIGGLGLGALSRSLMPSDGCVTLTTGAAASFAGAFAAFGLGFARCLTGRARRYLTIFVAVASPVVLGLALTAASRAVDCG